MSAERDRLNEDPGGPSPWRRWGPYVSERAWGTVREDYSADGNAWDFFPHDHARSRAYRWNEDGLAGICDDRQLLCFALAFWNGRDADPQGAGVRAVGPAGQPRRGRQGVLVVPGQHAHALLDALALHVPPGGVPLRPPRRGEPAPRPRTSRSSSCSTPGIFDDGRYWEITADYAKATPGGHPDPRHGAQRRPGRRHAARAADAVVSQHLVLGGGHRRGLRSRWTARPWWPSTPSWAGAPWSAPGEPDAPVLRERDQRARGCSATTRRTRRRAIPRMGSTIT